MKDRLEDFIRTHREEFEFHEPAPELWKNIEGKKPVNRFRTKITKFSYRVAAVIVIFIASYAFHEYIDIRKSKRFADENEILYREIPELKETEFYYNNLVSMKLEELEPYFNQVPGMESDLKFDLNELDSIYLSLKNDLKDNIANQEVLEAMIQNYRMKLQILEDLLSEVKQEKSSDENEKDKYNI